MVLIICACKLVKIIRSKAASIEVIRKYSVILVDRSCSMDEDSYVIMIYKETTTCCADGHIIINRGIAIELRIAIQKNIIYQYGKISSHQTIFTNLSSFCDLCGLYYQLEHHNHK